MASDRTGAGRGWWVLTRDYFMDFPHDIQWLFEQSGWYSGRRVRLTEDLTAGYPNDHPALTVLAEFGGLTVGVTGAGEQCATSDVAFEEIHDAMEDIATWSALLETTLIGIAEVHHRHGQLFMDTRGRCYELSLIHDAFSFVGENLEVALGSLLLGRRVRPILRPDQQSVVLYGNEYNAGSPELYKY